MLFHFKSSCGRSLNKENFPKKFYKRTKLEVERIKNSVLLPVLFYEKGEYMTNWKIDNQSQRHLMIQEHANEISIVEPYHNGSFKILAEINLNQTSNEAQLNDENLYVSVSKEHKEISIFDKVK